MSHHETVSTATAAPSGPTLRPTRERITLLQDVDHGQVVFSTWSNTALNLATLPGRPVLRETAEMRQAGWIDVDLSEGADTLGSYPYALTDAGRAILENGVK
ncbi:hypothetical protein [Micromonospora sp. RV43]|uniref:hypothetical protein n=1 Tax=Micromonospora sp. RV43 TaxID=1661387 RepID=UPI00064BBDB3|nr:hypothetical protein [Micromonospora sp. RV43]